MSWASPVIRAAGHIWGIRISRALAVAAAAVEVAAWVAAPAVRQAWRAMAALAAAVVAAAGAMSVGIGSAMHRGKLQWVLLLAQAQAQELITQKNRIMIKSNG